MQQKLSDSYPHPYRGHETVCPAAELASPSSRARRPSALHGLCRSPALAGATASAHAAPSALCSSPLANDDFSFRSLLRCPFLAEFS